MVQSVCLGCLYLYLGSGLILVLITAGYCIPSTFPFSTSLFVVHKKVQTSMVFVFDVHFSLQRKVHDFSNFVYFSLMDEVSMIAIMLIAQ
jgi:hypothetical protein